MFHGLPAKTCPKCKHDFVLHDRDERLCPDCRYERTAKIALQSVALACFFCLIAYMLAFLAGSLAQIVSVIIACTVAAAVITYCRISVLYALKFRF